MSVIHASPSLTIAALVTGNIMVDTLNEAFELGDLQPSRSMRVLFYMLKLRKIMAHILRFYSGPFLKEIISLSKYTCEKDSQVF